MNLNFKYGLFEKLASQPQVPGTVYVTADEKAMYVDMPSYTAADGTLKTAERVRINQIVVKDSVRDAKPPYSEGAFYYFIQENALLIWAKIDDKDGEAVMGWKQVNSTQAIQDQYDTLKGRIDTLDTDVSNLKTAVGTSADAATADTVFGKIAAIEEEIGDAADTKDENTIYGKIAAEKDRAEKAEEALVLSVNGNATAISELTELVGDAADNTDSTLYGALNAEIERAKAAEKEINDKVGDAADNTDSTLYGALNAEIERAKAAEKENSDAIGQEIVDRKAAVEAEANRAKGEEARIEGLITGDNGIGSRVDELEGLVGKTDAEGLRGAISGHDAQIGQNITDISSLKGTVGDSNGGLVKDVADNADAIKALQDTVGNSNGGLVKDVEDLQTFVENISDPDTGFNAQIDNLNQEIQDLKDIDSGLGERITNLETTVNDGAEGVKANAAAIDALQNTVGDSTKGLVKDVTEHTEQIGQNASDISGLGNRTKSLEDSVNNTTSGLAATYNIASGNATKIGTGNLYEGSGGTLISAVNKLDERADLLEEKVDANAAKLAGIDDGTVKDFVEDSINASLAAADAMKFIKGISALSELPTTDVEAGWTYVVETTFTDETSKVTYYAGDMLVAKQDLSASAIGNWAHVKTGYWKESQALGVEESEENNQAAIQLTDGTGSVEFSEVIVKGEGVKISSSATNNLTISLVWEPFA